MAGLDLHEPVELTIRGERMDLVGLLAGVQILLNDYDIDETVPKRSRLTINQIMEHVRRHENIGLVERELKKVVKSGEAIDYRGVDVVYRAFDPRVPEPTNELELPDLGDADAYLVAGRLEDSYFADMWPKQVEPREGLAMAAWLRMYARDLEHAVTTSPDDQDEPLPEIEEVV